MVVDLMVKRLLLQAGVAVLTGVLMSSAVSAEDTSDPVNEVSVNEGTEIGEPVDTSPIGVEIPQPELENPELGNEGPNEVTDIESLINVIPECGFEFDQGIFPTEVISVAEEATYVAPAETSSSDNGNSVTTRVNDRDDNDRLPWYWLRRKLK